MNTNRIPSSSPDLTQHNIDKLKELFPEIVTEDKVDFDMLKTILGEEVDNRNERYKFEWHGKKDSLLGAQQPSKGTLRPDKEASKNFDTTENLYIEGDNLEVLKLLQKSYNGKVKMIYIDPPYNTGNDFVYKDNFQDNVQNYLEQTGQLDGEGNKISTNTETSGRKHTNWLNMMYPRLKLARNLLTEDGAIFISIDQNEIDNLTKVCKELYGEQNYIGEFIWSGGRKNDSKYISISHEYVLVFVKNKEYLTESKILWRQRKEGLDDIYQKAEEFYKKHKNNLSDMSSSLKNWYKSLSDNHPSKQHKHYSFIDDKGVFYTDNISWPGGGGPVYNVLHPITKKPVKIPSRGWLFNEERMKEMVEKDLVYFGEDETKVPTFKRYLKDTEFQVPYSVMYQDSRGAMKRLRELMGGKIFDFPKDEEILLKLIETIPSDDSIILDFFSGSASTAHATMKKMQKTKGSANSLWYNYLRKWK